MSKHQYKRTGILLSVLLSSLVGYTASAATPNLEGTAWKLITWNESSPLSDTQITLFFDDNILNGSAGCNQYRTGYQIDGENIKIKPEIATTFKACPEPIMQQENQYLEALQSVDKIVINSQGELQIFYRASGKQGIMTFTSTETSDNTSPQTSNQKTSSTWLDQKLVNWNKSGANIPQASNLGQIENRCQKQIRNPSTPADKTITRAGWKLFGAVQVYSDTSVISAMSGVDGMCRPMGYQEFVFVKGQFAGTLSPTPMNSRTDGASGQIFLTGESDLIAEFRRYSESDAFCCPSKTSRVSYQIERKNDKFVLVPTQVTTEANQST